MWHRRGLAALEHPSKARLRCGRTILSRSLKPCSDLELLGAASVPSLAPLAAAGPQTAQTGEMGAQLRCKVLPEPEPLRTGLEHGATNLQQVEGPAGVLGAGLEPHGSAELLETGV